MTTGWGLLAVSGAVGTAGIDGVVVTAFDDAGAGTTAAADRAGATGVWKRLTGSAAPEGGTGASTCPLRPVAARGADAGACGESLAAGRGVRIVPVETPDLVALRATPESADCEVEELDSEEEPLPPVSAPAVAHVAHNPVATAPTPTATTSENFPSGDCDSERQQPSDIFHHQKFTRTAIYSSDIRELGHRGTVAEKSAQLSRI